MALVECPECKKAVSSSAQSCPGCGHPILIDNDVALTELPMTRQKAQFLVNLCDIMIMVAALMFLLAIVLDITKGGILFGVGGVALGIFSIFKRDSCNKYIKKHFGATEMM